MFQVQCYSINIKNTSGPAGKWCNIIVPMMEITEYLESIPV